MSYSHVGMTQWWHLEHLFTLLEVDRQFYRYTAGGSRLLHKGP